MTHHYLIINTMDPLKQKKARETSIKFNNNNDNDTVQ